MTSWVRISDHRGFAAVGDAVGGSSDDQNSRQLKLLSNHHRHTSAHCLTDWMPFLCRTNSVKALKAFPHH